MRALGHAWLSQVKLAGIIMHCEHWHNAGAQAFGEATTMWHSVGSWFVVPPQTSLDTKMIAA